MFLFDDALNIFYLQLYGVGHIVEEHSDSKRGIMLPLLHLLLFHIHHPTDWTAHTTVFVTSVMEHWLEWEIAQWFIHEKTINNSMSRH